LSLLQHLDEDRDLTGLVKFFGIESGDQYVIDNIIDKSLNLKTVLEASDVVVITTPLTLKTRNLIGQRQLEWMKQDAILINVGRGDVIDQKALYDHLKSHSNFRAGIDTWWSEPVSRGPFQIDYPFFELPNIIGSPHCADHVPRAMADATRKALENVKQFLLGHKIRGILNRKDYS